MAFSTYDELKGITGGSASGSSSSSKESKFSNYDELKKVTTPIMEKTKKFIEQRDLQQKKIDAFNESVRNAQIAEEQAQKAQKTADFWQSIADFPKEVLKSAVVRPALSLAEIPKNVYGSITGKPTTFGSVNVPFVGPVETYQNEAQRLSGEIVAGEKPVTSILKPMGEAVLDVSMLGAGGSAVKNVGKEALMKTIGKSAATNAGYGAGYGLTQSLGEGADLKQTAKNVGTGIVVGGALGAGISSGAYIARSLEKKVLTQTVKNVEKEVGKLDIHEVSLIEQGLKNNLTDNEIIKGINSSRGVEMPKTGNVQNKSEHIEATSTIPENKTSLTEKKPSKIALSVEQKAVERGLKTNPDYELAGYTPLRIKEEAKKATDIVNKDFENARSIIRGEKSAPKELKNEFSLVVAMEERIKKTEDIEEAAILSRELAKSPLISKTSKAGQTLRIASEREQSSAVSNITKVSDERIKVFEEKTKKNVSTAIDEESRNIAKKIKQKVPTREDWNSFVDSITC